MNIYLTILNYLDKQAGSPRFQKIDQFLNGLGLLEEEDKKEVLTELDRQGYIRFQGGTQGLLGVISYGDKTGGSPVGASGGYRYEEFEAKITLEGLKYLDQMEKAAANNTIHITGNQNQLVVGSTHVSINAQQQIKELVDEAIKVINDTDSRNRDAHIATLRQLQQESEKGEVQPSTSNSLLELGNQVSGIGSFVLAIQALLQGLS